MEESSEDWIKETLAKAMLADSDPVPPTAVPPTAVPPTAVAADAAPLTAAPASPSTRSFPMPAMEVSSPQSDRPASGNVIGAAATLVDMPDVEAILDLDPTGVLGAELSNSELERVDPDDEPGADESSFVRGLVEWIVVLVGAVLVALLLRTFLFQAFWIPSESMEATLLKQDRVLVNKLSYRLHDVNRGDVVVFRRPDEEQAEIRDLIKRVIALPGESVEARGNAIYIDGGKLIEPYLDPAEVINDFGPIIVPEGQMFVMGDNRDESYDSRFFGTVDEDRIVGRAFVLFWPIGRIGTL